MPEVHLETAITQFNGTIALVTEAAADAAGAARRPPRSPRRRRPRSTPWPRPRLARRRLAQVSAAEGQARGRADHSGGFADPRLGPELFSRKLSLTLQTAADADAILARAEADLERITEEITRVAAGLGGTPREVLDRLGAAAPDEATILAFCAQALAAQTTFVRDHDLVTVYDDKVELIDMPRSTGASRSPTATRPDRSSPRRCRRSSRSRPRMPTGRPTGLPRSTASTTGTWCTT